MAKGIQLVRTARKWGGGVGDSFSGFLQPCSSKKLINCMFQVEISLVVGCRPHSETSVCSIFRICKTELCELILILFAALL